MACNNNCSTQTTNTCSCGNQGGNVSNNGSYIIIIVLYILLAIILGSVLF